MTGPHLPGCLECWVLVIGNNLGESGAVISTAERVGHARVCPTARGAIFSPRTWDQGSLCPGFGPKNKRFSLKSEKADVHTVGPENIYISDMTY